VLLLGPRAAADRASLRAALAFLDNAIDAAAMRAANRHVDLDGGTVEEAARMLSARIRAAR